MARLPVTLNEAEGHFFALCNTHVLITVCLHINWKAHVAYDLNLIVKGERVLKVTGTHVISRKLC